MRKAEIVARDWPTTLLGVAVALVCNAALAALANWAFGTAFDVWRVACFLLVIELLEVAL